MTNNNDDHLDGIQDTDQWLEILMMDYGEKLIRVAYLYLKDWKLAEDVVQETFIKCFLKQKDFRGDSSVKTWIYSILTNACRDILRSTSYKKTIIVNKLYPYQDTYTESPEDAVIQNEDEYYLSECVLSLPIKYREVIILFYYESLTINEISNLLKTKNSTIKVRLKRGREKLRKLVDKGVEIYAK
ncbi:sigma-70 family RNA polymerase sigma factor [Heyndrickxia oleronia]|uniref:sigma-70 family RNA polymerase sigma factor n=1 Tax=Heyndrickxia oleronia TaxID=38875 RepID=UPI001C0EDA22|nr:sigma-70 family RNA polymerase sigma factor [Heyndrickxia oleronia]MBU5210561.1 sigma-70 family RNA polymerase sigma factor [Heyndrickxia oleronia]MCM3455092.1 sigma-70 family RNA polymerase sigma factor [Heyndrickxia oleronia]